MVTAGLTAAHMLADALPCVQSCAGWRIYPRLANGEPRWTKNERATGGGGAVIRTPLVGRSVEADRKGGGVCCRVAPLPYPRLQACTRARASATRVRESVLEHRAASARSHLRRRSRGQRHADHCDSPEQQVDTDQQAQRPGRRFRQARKNDAGKNEIDNAASQHPAP